jgi:ABC-type bacteriocin/lantibiotic exporter with double-glycine peptidase domain
MNEHKILARAWGMLEPREKTAAIRLLAIVLVAAVFETVMIGSVLPFLSVLANPDVVHSSAWLSWAYQSLGFETTRGFLFALGGMSLFLIVVANLAQVAKTYSLARFSVMRVHGFSVRLLAHYMRQPYEFFLNRETSTMGRNVLGECSQIVSRFFQPTLDMIASSLTALMIVGLMLFVDATITLLAFGLFAGVYGLVFYAIRKRLRRAGEERLLGNTGRFRYANEALGGIKDIKVVGREASYVARYEEASLRDARGQILVRVCSDLPRFILQTVAFGGIIILCLVMLTAADDQPGRQFSDLVPVLGVFAFAAQRLLPALQRIYAASAQLRFARAAIDALHADIAAARSEHGMPVDMPPKIGLRDRLEMDGVSYRYPDSEHGLNGLSLTIRQGEKIGVVGSTGAGKTTFADIVLGLLAPQEGAIRVDGVPITEENLRAWQQTVGYVPQNIFLSDASVAQNIAFGVAADRIDRERVHSCGALAQLERFVREDLPDGYDTVVGERGIRLSGGQRQRIGIARALYHDADLILFDEATSALDNQTERQVMNSIEALPGDKTIIMIAHRLSTVRICDRIMVLDRGRLADMGTWEDLIERSDLFRTLVEMARMS